MDLTNDPHFALGIEHARASRPRETGWTDPVLQRRYDLGYDFVLDTLRDGLSFEQFEMSGWTHALCRSCYAAVEPGREPHRVVNAPAEECCRCGRRTVEPIFYRSEPTAFACGGTGGTHDDDD